MIATAISPQEKEEIQKYFGLPLEDLTPETFRQILRQLRAKFHPDAFEKFEDPTVREVMTEKFQTIERLAEKIEQYFNGKAHPSAHPGDDVVHRNDARFAFDKMKIEIITSDKDLKYHLFGAYYRWLKFGEKFKIPDSQASIIIDEDHAGLSIGFRESVRLYLTFGVNENIDEITRWLFDKIEGRATYLLIEGKKINPSFSEMLTAIKRVSLLPPGA
jgi:hypothetical protein